MLFFLKFIKVLFDWVENIICFKEIYRNYFNEILYFLFMFFVKSGYEESY